MSNQVFGTATIRMNGETLRTMPGATHDPGGPMRNTVKAAKPGDVAFSEEGTESITECEVMVDKDFDIEKFRNARDITVLFEADTGQTYIQKGAWCEKPPTVKTGSAAVKFVGPPSIQA